MHTLTAIPALIFAAQLGAPAEERAADAPLAPPVECFPETMADQVHLADIADRPIAVPGARWWVPRFAEDGSQEFFSQSPLVLIEQQSRAEVPLAAEDVHETFAAVSVPVPEQASPGQIWELWIGDDTSVAELRVAVGEAAPSSGGVEATAVQSGGPQRCEVFCAMDGLTLPATPQLTFTQSGGPFVLDAYAAWEGEGFEEQWTHRADSYWLAAVDAPTTVTIDLDERGFTGGTDVHVRVRDPVTLDVVHDELIATAPLAEVPADTEGLPPCDQINPTPTGCGFFGGSAFALVFAPVLAVRLRRLRRRSSSRS